MQFFRLRCSFDDKPIEGQHPYHLPMIRCPHCNNHRGTCQAAYPWLDLKKIFDSDTLKRLTFGKSRRREGGWEDLNWEELVNLKLRIRESLDPNFPLGPCATFGGFFGKLFARPKATDFVFTDSEVLLARRSVVQKLNELGNNLQSFEIKLQLPKNSPEDYVEIWAPPLGLSGPSSGNRYCEYCERGQDANKFIIAQPPNDFVANVFVLKDGSSPKILSEKLIGDIQANQFSGLNYAPMPCE